MALGEELKPHLPFIRRYARALTGSQAQGDNFVRATLEAIVTAPEAFPRDVDPRLGLYKTFHAIWSSAEFKQEPKKGKSKDLESIAQIRLGGLSRPSREALLLTAMEGFTPEDTGYLIGASAKEVKTLVAEALTEVQRQTRADVLIIEDEPVIALDIETIVRDLGHNVVGVAVTREDAVQKALERPPTLVLADIQLADGFSGVDAVIDILRSSKVPVIFITAFPEKLLTETPPLEPMYLITKPFQRSTLKAQIAQALFFDIATLPTRDPDKPSYSAKSGLEPISQELVRSRPGPVNAKVVNGQLRLVDSTTTGAAQPLKSMEAVRKMHLATARRLCAALAGSNVGPGFNARLEAIRKLLMRSLSLERSLLLGIQVRGLESMMPAICERLDDVTAADVSIFASDLADLLLQFPSYRQFVKEAQDGEQLNEAARDATAQIAGLLAAQADVIVEPSLKAAIAEVQQAAEDQDDPVVTLAFVRTIGNTFRAVGRFFNERIAKIQKKATGAFDETAGKVIGKGLAYLLVATPVGGLLTLLYSLYPAEFGFVSQLLRAVKAIFQLVYEPEGIPRLVPKATAKKPHLRAAKSLPPRCGGDNYIETVWGRGYVLREPEEVEEQKVA